MVEQWTKQLGEVMKRLEGNYDDPRGCEGSYPAEGILGFCGLSILLLGYLVDRQLMICQLRKQLVEEQKKIIHVRLEASMDLSGTLPGFEHFQDRLAMEHRRAVTARQPLSLERVVLKASRDRSDATEVAPSFGDAAKALIRKLRGEDSIYLSLRLRRICIVLPRFGLQQRAPPCRPADGRAPGRFGRELALLGRRSSGQLSGAR